MTAGDFAKLPGFQRQHFKLIGRKAESKERGANDDSQNQLDARLCAS